MATNKPKQAIKGLTRAQLTRVWTTLDSQAWLSIAKDFKPKRQFTLDGFNSVKGRCVNPLHEDKNPSFWVYPDRHFAVCRGCNMHITNPIELVQKFTDFAVSEAINYLRQHFNIEFLSKDTIAELEEQRTRRLVKQEICAIAHQEMCNALNDPNNPRYAQTVKSLDWLVKTRLIDAKTLYALPVGVMPGYTQLHEEMSLRYVAKLKQSEHSQGKIPPPENLTDKLPEYVGTHATWNYFPGAVVFPLHATPSEIGRIKLRAPLVNEKTFIVLTDDYEDTLGLYGLGWDGYSSFFSNKQNTEGVYVTEGEIDVLSWMSRIVKTRNTTAPFPLVSAGGMGSSADIEPILKSTGTDHVFLIGDAPSAKGDTVVRAWLNGMKHLHAKIFTGWDAFAGCGDIDEAVNKYGESKIIDELYTNRDANYVSPGKWAYQQADADLTALTKTDLRVTLETTAMHGRYIKHRLDLAEFLELICTKHSLNESLLRREISCREDTPNGFVQRCQDALEQLLFTVGQMSTSSSVRVIHLFDKKTKNMHKIELGNEKSLKSQLAPISGRIINFIEEHVGIPTFMRDEFDGLSDRQLGGNLLHYLTEACLNMAAGAPDMAGKHSGQGYHCTKGPNGELHEHIVCGSNVFKLERINGEITYTMLEGPADRTCNMVFDISKKAWGPGELSVAKLNTLTGASLKDAYNDLVKLYDTCFKFQKHTIIPRLLAGCVLCLPLTEALLRPLLLYITGESQSGKTSLVSTFCDKIGSDDLRIMMCGQGEDSYTHAGIATQTDRDSRSIVIDEFESDDAKKGKYVPGILEMYRGLISGSTQRTLGQPGGGSAVTQYFNLSVVYSAITGTARPQDANRMVTIHTKKIAGRASSEESLSFVFTPERLAELRDFCSFGIFQYAQDIAAAEKEIRAAYSGVRSKLKVPIDPRHASGLFAALGVMKCIGEDWEKFLLEYVEANAIELRQMSDLSESDAAFSKIIRTPIVKTDIIGMSCSIAQLLTSPERRELINSSATGTYFDSRSETLVILLDTIIVNIRHFADKTVTQLKGILDRHPQAVSDTEIHKLDLLNRISRILGAGIKTKDIAVISVKDLLNSKSANPQSTSSDGEENGNENTEIKKVPEEPRTAEREDGEVESAEENNTAEHDW
jgi:hypothetical protein